MKAIIFDVDGTLAETEEVHRQAFNETFQAWGLDWHWDQPLYAALLKVTGGKERMRHFIDAYNPNLPSSGLDDEAIRDLHAEKTNRYTDLIASGSVGLRPGVQELINGAEDAGMTLAISTTTSIPNVEALLKATLGAGSMDRFAAIGAGDIVAHKKPAPDIYLKVLDDLAIQPSDCIALEDSRNGLLSALAAGIPTLITRSIYTDGQDFSGALAVVHDLAADLPNGFGPASDPECLRSFFVDRNA